MYYEFVISPNVVYLSKNTYLLIIFKALKKMDEKRWEDFQESVKVDILLFDLLFYRTI